MTESVLAITFGFGTRFAVSIDGNAQVGRAETAVAGKVKGIAHRVEVAGYFQTTR